MNRLADIIDYDALHTGKRSEGVYTVAETNLQQFIEVRSLTLTLTRTLTLTLTLTKLQQSSR